MSPRAESASAPESSECGGISALAFYETFVVKCRHVGAPYGGILMSDDIGHENCAAFAEKVFVVEVCILHNLPDTYADGVVAENFLKGRGENGAL